MPRNFSFWILLGLVALFALLLFHVVKPYIVAIFVAAVLSVLFTPLHQWLTRRLAGHNRVAAALTTLAVLLLVLIPISFTLLMAGSQVMQGGNQVTSWFDNRSADNIGQTIEKVEQMTIGTRLSQYYDELPAERRGQLRQLASRVTDGFTEELYQKTRGLLSDFLTFAVSVCIMALGLYYFLADRGLFVRELQCMMPLESQEEKQLMDQFEKVCRGVVLGTVLAGVVQATLAGFAFAALGVPHLWLLIVLSMFCSFIPFVGSTVVWGLVAVWLLLEGRYGAGVGMAIYGGVIIATADNLVRAHVIGNEAKLHPLIALVTVLGALKLMGLWGIFVGPMVAAFLYALLNITHDRFVGKNLATAEHNGDAWCSEVSPRTPAPSSHAVAHPR